MKSNANNHFKILVLIIALVLSGCVRPAPINNAPAGEVPDEGLPEVAPTSDNFFDPTEEPAENNTADEPDVTPTMTLFISAPTEPTTGTEAPDVTAISTLPPIPTKTPTQVPLSESGRFDPEKAYGQAQFDKASFLHLNNWMANSGDLPDDSNIQLALDADGNLSVTGKNALYYTWWFSAPYVEDGYVEMEVRTGDVCEGRSGYGMILNGPQKGTSTSGSHGYIILLSCDGYVFMDRLDATRDPNDGSSIYASTNMFWWTEDENIQRGQNKTNTLGVLIEEGTITIYVNGFVFYTVYDDTYSGGRLGMFVYPDETENFTYTVTDLTIWELSK